MEKLIDVNHGIGGLLVSLCVLLSIQLLVKVGEFLWKLREKQDSASEAAIKELTKVVQQNTVATEHLDLRLGEIELILSEMPKFKIDMRRMFSAVKIISGDKWPEIRKEIMEEETTI